MVFKILNSNYGILNLLTQNTFKHKDFIAASFNFVKFHADIKIPYIEDQMNKNIELILLVSIIFDNIDIKKLEFFVTVFIN